MQQIELGNISFPLPDDWTVTMAVFSGPEEQFGPREARFRHNIALSTEAVSPSTDARSYADEKTRFLQAQLPDYAIVTDQEIPMEKAEGGVGVLREQVFTGPNGMKLQQAVLYFIKDGIGYSLAGSHLLGMRYNAIREDLIHVFENLRSNY